MQATKSLSLDVVIPAHNEEDVILLSIATISEVLSKVPNLNWKIIVAENGSQDKTFEIVHSAHLPNVAIFSARNRGKGGAIKESLAHAHGEYFAFIDADLSPDPRAIPKMVSLLEEKNSHLVVSSRFHKESIVDRNWYRHTTSWFFNFFAKSIIGVSVADTQCGLKIMDSVGKEYLKNCQNDTWLLDLELIARMERAGHEIISTPVVWREYPYPNRESKLNVFHDGVGAIRGMFSLRKILAPHPKQANL